MKQNLKVYSLVIAAIALFLALAVYGQKSNTPKAIWEYQETVNSTPQQLNTLGSQGWELVGYTANENNRFYLFKRAK